MVGRVVMVFDVTLDEAADMAEKIGEDGAFRQFGLPQVIRETGEFIANGATLPNFTIRTDASMAAGGPHTPVLTDAPRQAE